MDKATVCIKLWINLGKHSNNYPIVVEKAVGNWGLADLQASDLLGKRCGEQIRVKV
jgi:hypothetical protein